MHPVLWVLTQISNRGQHWHNDRAILSEILIRRWLKSGCLNTGLKTVSLYLKSKKLSLFRCAHHTWKLESIFHPVIKNVTIKHWFDTYDTGPAFGRFSGSVLWLQVSFVIALSVFTLYNGWTIGHSMSSPVTITIGYFSEKIMSGQ